MTDKIYTAITFSPIQGFIEKSRKLRDLYGSSFLLSFLGWVICSVATTKKLKVISPALPNVAQGMPNQIIIEGDFSKDEAKEALDKAWKCVMDACQEWIEENITQGWDYNCWKRIWRLWSTHSWEFFWVQGKDGDSVSKVRELMNEVKRSRDWVGVNWQGESSTLSGTDAIAYPELGKIRDPRQYNYGEQKAAVSRFYQQLSDKIGDSFIDPNEELSVPELVKRLITYEPIANKLIAKLKSNFADGVGIDKISEQTRDLARDLKPESFVELSRGEDEEEENKGRRARSKQWTGWFQGDGDKAGEYLKGFAKDPVTEADKITEFSTRMRKWGEDFKKKPFGGRLDLNEDSSVIRRVIYAGGDDFLGVFYAKPDDNKDSQQGNQPQKVKRKRNFKPSYCVEQFSTFKNKVWDRIPPLPKNISISGATPITVSVGFVWASPSVPQRDVLQNCREAEKSAKRNGRDRIAFRILFSNGNYLEWVCPWWVIQKNEPDEEEIVLDLLSKYKDRDGGKNWTHIYQDIATLESRHAFNSDSTDVSFGLLKVYFGKDTLQILQNEKNWWNPEKTLEDNGNEKNKTRLRGGILGAKEYYYENSTEPDSKKVNDALNNWVINLAKVGFHLCQ